jgi:hypothetical protein
MRQGSQPGIAVATAPRYALVRDRGETAINVDLADLPLFRSIDALTADLACLLPAPGRYHVVEFANVPEDDREVLPGAFYRGEIVASFEVPVARWLVLRSLQVVEPH